MEIKPVFTENAPAPIGPYVQAKMAGDTLYISGQLGIDMKSGELADGVEAQAECAMENLAAILKCQDLGFDNVVKTTVFMTDLADFTTFNHIYAEYFPENPPARSCVQVAALPKGALVETECICVK